MTDQPTGQGGVADDDPTRPRFTDKRRIDPETGQVREQPTGEYQPDRPADDGAAAGPAEEGATQAPDESQESPAQQLADERLADLQRLQAEYVNYRRRVERDRDVARDQAVTGVIESLLGVLDDIDLARQHGELAEGPFASIADKLESALGRFGWERYGASGEAFDPQVHEALMHQHSAEVSEPTVSQVLQSGHRLGERIIRAARVAVVDPDA